MSLFKSENFLTFEIVDKEWKVYISIIFVQCRIEFSRKSFQFLFKKGNQRLSVGLVVEVRISRT